MTVPPPSQPSTYFQDNQVGNDLGNTNLTEEDEQELLHYFLSSDAPHTVLPTDYNPGKFDIVCGRSKFASQHCGNHRFRVTISIFLQQYLDKPERGRDRSLLFIEIVNTIRSSGARFVKYYHGQWCDIGDYKARRKVGRVLSADAVAFKDNAKSPKKTQAGSTANEFRP